MQKIFFHAFFKSFPFFVFLIPAARSVEAAELQKIDTSVVFGAVEASTPVCARDATIADEAHASFAVTYYSPIKCLGRLSI